MATVADIPTRAQNSTRQQHIDDHNRLTLRLQDSVSNLDYGTLQAAIDDAVSFKRNLIIAPKAYTLPSAMLLNNLSNLTVFAHGATFESSGDMPALLDMRDCLRCNWFGGWFKVKPGHVVDNAVYVYTSLLGSVRNTLRDVTVEGDYSVGLRVGKQGVGSQCDHMRFDNLEFIGRGLAGQIGVYAGDGVNGNCLNHEFTNLMCGNHETHVKVDRTNAYITNAFFDMAATADLVVDNPIFSIRNVRSEQAARFLVTGGPAGYLANITVDDVWYEGGSIAADGEWIQHKSAGYLKLSNVKCVNAAHAPVIKVNAGGPARVAISGLSTIATAAGAFALNNGATVKGDYIQHDSQLAVTGITTL